MSSNINKDTNETIEYYRHLYDQYGYSPKSLGWNKDRQRLRFSILMNEFKTLESPRILDVGCGFGDLNLLLKELFPVYSYTGIDITPEFIRAAENRYASDDEIRFILGDFISEEFDSNFDVVVASGTFNTRFSSNRNKEFIEGAFAKAFDIAEEGISFDFLSDKVDFCHEHTFHSSPEDILSLAYSYSRNLILYNNYIPFEFNIVVFKNNNFSKEKTVFERPTNF